MLHCISGAKCLQLNRLKEKGDLSDPDAFNSGLMPNFVQFEILIFPTIFQIKACQTRDKNLLLKKM